MKNLLGILLLFTGMAFGAFAFYPEAIDREAQLAELTAIVAAPAGHVTRNDSRDAKSVATGSIRSFAPQGEIIIPKSAAPASDRRDVAEATMKPSAAPSELPPVLIQGPQPLARPGPANGWQAIVTQEPGGPSGIRSSTPGDDHARYELVMSLQKELKRAGCYGGSLNGSWNANTKRAMTAFMDRVNSTLPMEYPDYILLTLLRGNATASCAGCPHGQIVADGRCVPKAIIAQSARKDRKIEGKQGDSGFTTTIAVAQADPAATTVRPAPLPGRMSIGGPRGEPPVVPAPAPAVNGWNIKLLPGAKSSTGDATMQAAKPGLQAPAAVPATKLAPDRAKTPGLEGSVVALADPVNLPPVEALVPGAVLPDGTAPGVDAAAAAAADAGVVEPRDDAPRAKRQRARGSSGRPQRAYGNRSTRSVQSMFQHPLGRM